MLRKLSDRNVETEAPGAVDPTEAASNEKNRLIPFDIEESAPDEGERSTTRVPSIVRKLYGDVAPSEFIRIAHLSLIFFLIMFAYWLLRALKDPIFAEVVGLEHQPEAKMLSVVFVLSLILVYNVLVDMFTKPVLFYVIGGSYGCTFLVISFFLFHPTIGLENDQADPHRLFGWIVYFAIESFGSIIVSLFWAFVNSTSKLENSKGTYGLIIAGAQMGAILGPSLATTAPYTGVPSLFMVAAFVVLAVPLAVRRYSSRFMGQSGSEQEKKRKPTGMLEGIKLLLKHPYLLGLLGTATLYEIIATIMDFEMKKLAQRDFESAGDPTEEFAQFMGLFGQATNFLSLVLSLLGTSYIVRRFGVRLVLIFFPTFIIPLVVLTYLYPTTYMFFFALICIKGLSYSLNNPAKEMLYLPTSDEVKFKAKSWIDIFGGRSAKAIGSTINEFFKEPLSTLLTVGPIFSFALCLLMVLNASLVGRKFESLCHTKTILGESGEHSEGAQDSEMVTLVTTESDDEGDDDAGSEPPPADEEGDECRV